ncbi:MAG: bifunctional rhamnulose-1-phosphate aldolase/short-chain dehydrogenase [Dehalococcoidia bacterium]|nr:bifunctional rhamnulose-1-phosphate aldolase/short-chain dehydrogenase [Dehalococcoidia bacterium]
MRNLWNDAETSGMTDLDLLVYQSRLVGAEASLVLWGGGNTSVKTTLPDFRGRDTPALVIKSSGADLKTARPEDFTALRLDDVAALFDRDDMPDEEMAAYLEHCALDPGGRRPSIETLLHAFIPAASVVHSHSDAVISLTNSGDPRAAARAVYGHQATVVEYLRPGFRLSKLVGSVARDESGCSGVVLSNHGLVTWGDDPGEAYQRHIDLVTRAEEYAASKARGKTVFAPGKGRRPSSPERRREVAAALAPVLRGLVCRTSRGVLRYDDSPGVLDLLASENGPRLTGIGPATPDHLVHTKRVPLWVDVKDPEDIPDLRDALGLGVDRFARAYEDWYRRHSDGTIPMRDPYPRVVLVPGVGMWTAGKDARAASIAWDMYRHTIDVLASAETVGSYTSLSERDAFEAEYWAMELYKLSLAPGEGPLAGRVALVTGGAHGIGEGICRRLAAAGAHVVVADLDAQGAADLAEDMVRSHGPARAMACRMDVTREDDVSAAFDRARLAYGGLDILVSNAGIAPVGAIDRLSLEEWQRAFDVNTTGHFLAAREAVRIMREQATGGSLVFIGTKNVPSPGKDFGAYSASKAAEVQLARVLAIENGEFGIRCNVVNPDAVFQGSNLWSREVREQRAGAHGIGVEEIEEFYRQRNLLRERVTASDVAETVLFLAGDGSAKTTGAMIPVDGGLRDAFPR